MHLWNKVKSILLAGISLFALHRKRLQRWGLVVLGILCILACTWFLVRDLALKWGLDRLQQSLSERKIEFQYDSAEFTQWQTVSLRQLQIKSLEQPDLQPILQAESLQVSLRWWTFWNMGLSQLKTNRLRLEYWEDSLGHSNLPNWSQRPNPSESSNSEDILVRFTKQLDRAIGKSPGDLEMRHTELQIHQNDNAWSCFIPSAKIDGSDINAQFRLTHNRQSMAQFSVSGELNHRQLEGSTLTLSPYSSKDKQAWIPFIFKAAGFQQATFSIESLDDDGQVLDLELSGEIKGLYAKDERLSDTTIAIKHLNSDLSLHLNSNHIELDSQSWVMIEELGFHPYASYQKSGPTYALGVYIPKTEAQQFFNSLPQGLFRNIGRIEAKGQLEYRFWSTINGRKPDSCEIFSRMFPSSDFSIVKWGEINVQKLNRPFFYSFYDRGILSKQFTVGPEWSGYTLLNEVSPKLIKCILQSEDPSFFHHKGFVPDAFRASLAANYKEKRFKRGASTISMQLVKNLFLGRRKTMARKVEEILITWLMERERVVNKTRLMEIYLNIVEWGPGLFGAKNASQFYFGKNALDLEWEEAAYLACLIPRPKSAYYTLTEEGCLDPRFSHVSFLLNHMAQKDPSLGIDTSLHTVCIQSESFQMLSALHGRARQVASDPTWSDSTAVNTEILSE